MSCVAANEKPLAPGDIFAASVGPRPTSKFIHLVKDLIHSVPRWVKYVYVPPCVMYVTYMFTHLYFYCPLGNVLVFVPLT